MKIPGCRALFASTGVKDDSLSAHYYIDGLLAFNTVNTAPVDTIQAFHKDGKKEVALPLSEDIINTHFKKIQEAGIDLNAILDKQIVDGLNAFEDAFQEILGNL